MSTPPRGPQLWTLSLLISNLPEHNGYNPRQASHLTAVRHERLDVVVGAPGWGDQLNGVTRSPIIALNSSATTAAEFWRDAIAFIGANFTLPYGRLGDGAWQEVEFGNTEPFPTTIAQRAQLFLSSGISATYVAVDRKPLDVEDARPLIDTMDQAIDEALVAERSGRGG